MSLTRDISNERCVVVFTCRGKERMMRERGSQAWRIDAARASKCQYLICVQNRNETWGQPSAPHKHAFLIARISRVEEVGDEGRHAIRFNSCADINVPNSWDGNRNPVAYGRLGDFGINTEEDIEDLSFTRVGTSLYLSETGEMSDMGDAEFILSEGDDYEAAAAASSDEQPSCSGQSVQDRAGISFDEARQGMSVRYGVRPEQIEILVRA